MQQAQFVPKKSKNHFVGVIINIILDYMHTGAFAHAA